MKFCTYINKETGESIEVLESTKQLQSDSDWKKAFVGRILYDVDELANNNMKLLLWLMDNMDKQNRIIEVYKTIAEKSGIPLISVKRAMKALINANIIIKVQTGVYMLNPALVASVASDKRFNLLTRYKILEKSTNE